MDELLEGHVTGAAATRDDARVRVRSLVTVWESPAAPRRSSSFGDNTYAASASRFPLSRLR